MCLKIFYDIIPGVSQETSWTLTNISYMAGSYLMFHYVRGVPFEFNAGAYDNLNMWEQIDDGAQYTPAKKFLLSVPIVLFLLSTHYTHYDLAYFTINFLAVLAVVIPKLPFVSSSHPAGLCVSEANSAIPTEPQDAFWHLFRLARGGGIRRCFCNRDKAFGSVVLSKIGVAWSCGRGQLAKRRVLLTQN